MARAKGTKVSIHTSSPLTRRVITVHPVVPDVLYIERSLGLVMFERTAQSSFEPCGEFPERRNLELKKAERL